VTYTYDELNRVRTYANVFGQVLTYSNDAEDHSTRREDSLGGVQTSTYNAVGLLTGRQLGGPGQTPVRVDLGYTDRYEQSSVTRYSDLAGTAVLGTSVSSYDDAGHLTGIVNTNNAGATLRSYTDTYDSAGRVSGQTWSS
jgi:YD repeat-containing protein